MQIENQIDNNLEIKNEQNIFLKSTIGKAIDNGIDIGLRFLLPDYIEDGVIELKNNMLKYGLKEGISKSIESVINIGKNAIGIITGDFKSIGQIQGAIKTGGIIDSISDLLDDVFNKIEKSGKVNSTIMNIVENGKDSILSNIEKNIEKTLNEQIDGVENLEKYINNWKQDYINKDFNSMEKEYKNIQNKIKDLIPIENTLNNARTIETLHNLIKNNNQNFNLSKEEIELAQKLNL